MPRSGRKRRVRRGVADEDAAEQRLRVVGHDELLVQAARRVGVDDLERLLGAREGVAEARDVDARELQLRRVVDARELGRAAEDPVGHDLRHRVRRRDETGAASLEARDLADRPDVRGGCRARRVDRNAAARTQLEAEVARELVARADADGEDDEVGVDAPPVRALDSHDRAVFDEHCCGTRAEMESDALGRDDPAERATGALVELRGHEPAAGVHDRGIRTELGEAACRLQSEEAAARDEHARRATVPLGEFAGLGDQRVHVVDRAVDAGVLAAGDAGHGRARAGGEHELVPVQRESARGRRGVRDGVDGDDALAGDEADVPVLPHRRGLQGEVGRGIRQSRAERDAVVGFVDLLADDGDAQGALGVARVQAVGEPVRRGPAADDDDVAHAGRCVCGLGHACLRGSNQASVRPGRFGPVTSR